MDKIRKTGGKPRKSEEIERYLSKIQSALLKGYSHEAIRDALGLPDTTFRRYLKRLGGLWKAQRLSHADCLLAEYHSRTEELYRCSIERYDKTKDVKFLNSAAAILNATFDRLQSAGFIPKASEKIKLQKIGDEKADYQAWMRELMKPAGQPEDWSKLKSPS